MAFWGKQGREPLRQNRWYIEFSENLTSFKFAIKECKKPEYEIGVTEHRLLTHTFRYPGLLKWKPTTIKFISAISEKGTLDKFIEAMTVAAGYNTPNRAHQSILKGDAVQSLDGLGGLRIYQIDEDGKYLQYWDLFNPFISSVNYGTLTYENEGFVEVNITIQYDWAEVLDNPSLIEKAKTPPRGAPGQITFA